MSILQEFKDFALKGNVVDMAVGIIIGGAFGTIVQSLVKDVIMPPIGMMLGGVDFSRHQDPAAGGGAGRDAGDHQHRRVPQQRDQLPDRRRSPCSRWSRRSTSCRKRFETESREGRRRAPSPSEIYLKEIRDALVKK